MAYELNFPVTKLRPEAGAGAWHRKCPVTISSISSSASHPGCFKYLVARSRFKFAGEISSSINPYICHLLHHREISSSSASLSRNHHQPHHLYIDIIIRRCSRVNNSMAALSRCGGHCGRLLKIKRHVCAWWLPWAHSATIISPCRPCCVEYG